MTPFFRRLGAEIRRRKVVPVVISYVLGAWVILQVAELTVEPLGLPAWSLRFIIVAAIAGLPLVFFLAWLIDFREQGLIFDLPLWPGRSKDVPRSRLFILACLMVLVIVATPFLAMFLLKQFPQSPAAVLEVIEPALPKNSIAVLAFENFSGNPESEYFASGLAEEILDLLAGLKELNVAARTSSFRFRKDEKDIRDIASLLNVRHILEGSVRRDGDRIRVTAQLIDGRQGYHDWSKTYDRNLNDVFAIQQEIAASVVNELKIALSVGSESRLQNTPTENIDAYIFFLQGREKLRSSQDPDVMKLARQLFAQAIKIDSTFSRAYAGSCEANLRLYEISNDTNDFKLAEQACGKAEELDPGLNSEIDLALGKLYRYRGWYPKAQEKLNAAIAIAPASVDSYIELGEVLSDQKQFTAAEDSLLRALDLKRNYWKAHEALASFYYRTERYSESAQAYEFVTRLAPDVASGFAGKGAAYWMLGDAGKATEAYKRSLQVKPGRQAYTNFGLFYYYEKQFEAGANMQKKALEYAPDDHRVWGRLGECYRFIPGREVDAQVAFERAVELALQNLAVKKEDWITRGQLGLYYAYLAKPERALNELALAVEESQRNPEVLLLEATALQVFGQTNRALDILEEIVEAEEQYRLLIKIDPVLLTIQSKQRFQDL